MNRVKSIWLLLSSDAVLCCNEQQQTSSTGINLMSLELFTKIAKLAIEQSWECTILADSNAIPEAYQVLCDKIDAHIVIPSNYNGIVSGECTTVVFESNRMEFIAKYPLVSRAILRVQRSHLPQLSKMTLVLLNHFPHISIKHPELLQYNDEDMIIYKDQLLEISQWLLDKEESWSDYRVSCLTDRFWINDANECSAGIKSLAIGPTGGLYLCTATAHDGRSPCGHILGKLEIPNRHLLTRGYSVPCGKCDASHCSRCAFLNKQSTLEFCVPSKNVCQIAHFEMEVQAWFAQQAMKKGLWNESFSAPESPTIYDPYELVKVEEAPPIGNLWHRLVTFDGHPENLRPPMMLDIIHNIQGCFQALVTCTKAGHAPSVELMKSDILASLRRQTIEQYRDAMFQKDCPTVHEIELLMCNAVREILNSTE